MLPYLRESSDWGLDIDLAVSWNGAVITRPPYRTMYWSPAQMLAHMTVNGAAARTGDLFASGTVSGPDRDQRGAFIELTWGGAEPVTVDGPAADVPGGRRHGRDHRHRAGRGRRPDRLRRGDRRHTPRPACL